MKSLSLATTKKKESPLKRFIQTLKGEVPFALGNLTMIWQTLFFLIPSSILIYDSFISSTESYLTFENYITILNSTFFTILLNSLLLAFTTTIICLVIGYPLAYTIKYLAPKTKNILLFLLIIPFWSNFILHMYAWFFILEREGFLNQFLLSLNLISSPLAILNTKTAIYIMMIYYYLPFMTIPIYSSMESTDINHLEASLSLGATKMTTIRKILIPLSMKGIISGVLLVFIPSFGEFIIPELMGGDKTYFVGNVISLFILGESTTHLGAAFTVTSLVFLLLCVYILISSLRRIGKFLSSNGGVFSSK